MRSVLLFAVLFACAGVQAMPLGLRTAMWGVSPAWHSNSAVEPDPGDEPPIVDPDPGDPEPVAVVMLTLVASALFLGSSIRERRAGPFGLQTSDHA